MVRGNKGEMDGREGRGLWDCWNAERGSDDIHIMTGLPSKNADKFSLDDSALWKTDEDVIAGWDIIPDDNHSFT